MIEGIDWGERIALMAIKENAPASIELEIIGLSSEGYPLNDLRKAGCSECLS